MPARRGSEGFFELQRDAVVEIATRAVVEASLAGLPSTQCFYVVVYDEANRPCELCFTGCSGD